jgi:membrane fusion protein, heavy metal efflux system
MRYRIAQVYSAMTRINPRMATFVVALAFIGLGFRVLDIGHWLVKEGTAKATQTASRERVDPFVPSDRQWANLTLQKVAQESFRSEIVTDGKIAIDEDRTTPVFSPYSGVVKRLLVSPGDPISAGMPLFTIEATDMVQAENDFIGALDGVKQAEVTLAQARTDEQRAHALFDAKAIAQKDWQQAQSNVALADAANRTAAVGLEAVRNRLRILKKTDAEIAEFENTGKINPETPIYAPIAGTIVQRKVGPGQYITTGAGDPSGDPVFVIGDLSTVWLIANVREADALAIKRGQDMLFNVLSVGHRAFDAKIDYIAETLDPTTRRLLVRASVDNPGGLLKPEMFARVSIFTDTAKVSLAIPRRAVIYEGDAAHIWVRGAGNALVMKPLRVGATSGKLVQVLDGLTTDDEIVTQGTLFIDRAANGDDAG